MNDKRDQLYDNLINSGRVSEDEIGNREQFKAAIKDEAASRQFYNNIIQSGLLSADEIGSEDDFYDSISADFSAPQQPTGYQPSAEDMAGFMGTINRAGKVASGSVQSFDRKSQNLQKRQGLNVPQQINIGESGNLVQGEKKLNPETGQLEDTYITSSGNEYNNKALADMEQRQIDQNLRDQKYKESLPGQLEDAYAERDRLNKELGKIQGQWVDQDGRVHYGNRGNDETVAALEAALRQNQQRITALEAERDDDGGTQFWRGFIDAAKNPSVQSFGLTDFNDMLQLMRIKNKVDAAQEVGQQPQLTDAEQALMQSTFLNNYAQQQYGENRGFMYRAGGISMQALPFVAEFMATGGFSALSQKGAELGTRAAEKLALQGLSKTLMKNLGIVAGDVAAGWAMANTTGLFRTAGDVMQRNIGDVTMNPEGEYDFGEYDEEGNFHRGGKGIGRSIYEAEVANTLEYYTEKLGEHLQIGKWLAKGADKMGLSKLSKVVNYLSGSKWLERGGIQDYPSEVVEEQANLLLNAMLVGDNTFSNPDDPKSVINPKTQADIFGGMLFSIGLMQAPRLAQTGYSAVEYYKYKNATDKADADASSIFGADNWQMIKDEIDSCPNENIGDLMSTVVKGGMSDEQKQATMNYAANLIKMRGYNVGMMAGAKDETESMSNQGVAAQTVNQSYVEGHETQDPDLMKQFNDEAQAAAANLPGKEFAKMVTTSEDPVQTLTDIMSKRDIYSDEQIAAAADYYQKMSRVNGVMDGALSRIDLEVERLKSEVRANTHQATGNVYWAKGADNVDYNVIGGDIMTDPDTGLPVLTGTGGAVVVRDQFGNVSVKSPQELTMYSMRNADEMINGIDTEVRQQLMQQADDDMTYGSPANEVYQLEDTVTLMDGEGNVIDGEIGMMPNAVDGVYVVYTPDGKALQYTADQLNRMIVNHNGQEVKYATPITPEAEAQQPTKQPQPELSGTLDNATGEPAAAEDAGQESNQPQSALDRIPILTDEKGKPVLNRRGKPQYQWHKASVEDAAAALVETTGGDMVMARDTASDLVKNAQAGLEKIRKQKPKGEDPIEIAESRMEIKRQEQEQQAIIKQWQDVGTAIRKQMESEAAARQAEIEAAKSEEQRQREAEEARIRKEKQDEQDRQRLREAIERDHEKRNREYQPLTDARKEMADDPDALAILNDTEPRSLEEFVSSLLRPHSLLWQDASDTERGLQSELGWKRADMQRMMSLLGTKESGAKPFGQVVLDIHEGLPEAMKQMYTDEDVRNTLLSLFGEGNSDSMMHLTERNRIAEARETMQQNLLREAEAELEAWAEAYHLTPEEREAFEDYLAQTASEPEQEIINNIIADNEYKQSERSAGEDQQPVSRADVSRSEGGEGQVQQETQASGNGNNEAGPAVGTETPASEQAVSDDNVSEEGVIPRPEVDIPRFNALRRQLRQAYRDAVENGGRDPKTLQAIRDAAREMQKYVDEGLDCFNTKEQEYYDEVQEYDGKDPGRLADQYITRLFLDRYCDNDDDQLYIYTGLKPDMREEFKLLSYNGKQFVANEHGVCTNPNVIENWTKGYIGFSISTALSEKGWVGAYNVQGSTYGASGPVTAGWNDQYFETEEECQAYQAQRALDYLKRQNDSKMKKYEVALQAIIDKAGKKPTPIVSVSTPLGNDLFPSEKPMVPSRETSSFKQGNKQKKRKPKDEDFRLLNHGVRLITPDGTIEIWSVDYDRLTVFDIDENGNRSNKARTVDTVDIADGLKNGTITIVNQPIGKTSSPEKIAEEEAKVDTNPSEAQKEAGNYQKGHINVDGYDITIENPKGSIRSGVDKNGKKWSQEMHNTYGYIRGTEGIDGDHIDVFLSDNPASGQVFVVDQVDPETGKFDEHKVMYGFTDAAEATQAYLSNYQPGWMGLGAVSGVSREAFKEWVNSSHRKTKPFLEYALAKREQAKKPKLDKNDYHTYMTPEARQHFANDPRFASWAHRELAFITGAVWDGVEIPYEDLKNLPEIIEAEKTIKEAESKGKLKISNEETDRLAKRLLDTDQAKQERKALIIIGLPAGGKSSVFAKPLSKQFGARIIDSDDVKPWLDGFDGGNGAGYVHEASAEVAERAIDMAVQNGDNILLPRIGGNSVIELAAALRLAGYDVQLYFNDVKGVTSIDRAASRFAETGRYLSLDYLTKKAGVPSDNFSKFAEETIGDYLNERTEKEVQNIRGRLGRLLGSESLAGARLRQYGADVRDGEGAADQDLQGMVGAGGLQTAGNQLVVSANDPIFSYSEWKSNDVAFGEKPKEIWNSKSGQPMPTNERKENESKRKVSAEPRTAGEGTGQASGSAGRAGEEPGTESDRTQRAGSGRSVNHQRLVSDSRMEELKKQLKNKLLGQANVGVDPEILSLGAQLAVGYLERGITKFADFAKVMIEEVGDFMRPYLKSFYNAVRDMPEAQEYAGQMDDYQTVSSFDVLNFDKAKKVSDPITKAEHVVKEQKINKQAKKIKAQQPDLFAGDLFGTQEEPAKQEQTRKEPEKAEETQQPAKPKQDLHKNKRNNQGERGKDYAPTSPKARFNANVEALKMMRALIEDGVEAPTKDQMEVLRQYSGWGGLGTYFNDESSAENKILRDLLSDEEYNDAVMSINSAYFTPATVIDSLWDIAKAMGFKGGNVLEGSAGIGNIIGQMPVDMSRRSDIEAVEIDSVSGNILKLLYPDAKVHIQGFQDTVIPNGSVDLAVTNVPFVTGLHVIDKVDKDLSRKFTNIHDFCIAKNIRKLREGGIGLFITSAGTLDKSTKLREWITDEGQADVVGAFRLNNKTFGGTNVTSDIIVVRKRVNGQKLPNAIDISKASPMRVGSYEDKYGDQKQVSMVVNDYFINHPEMMAGEMAFGYEKGDTFRPGSYGLYPVEGMDQEKMLSDFAKSMSKAKETPQPKQEPEQVQNQLTAEKEGRMLVDDNGRLCVSQRGVAVPLGLNDQKVKGFTKQQCFEDYQAVQKAVDDVLQQQLGDPDDAALKPKLDALNKAFDKFTKRYGTLHKNTAISFLRNDIDFPSFLALENYSETKDINGKVTVKTAKAPLFSQRVLGFKTEPKPKTIKDAVIASIFRGNNIDLEWIADKLGKSVDDVRTEILNDRLAFEDPSTGQLEIRYKYLSGNVREKLTIAEGYNTDGKYSTNIEELRKVVPMDIPSHLIDFSLGSSWIPVELYKDYMKDTLDLSNVRLNHVEGTWAMDEGYFRNEKNRSAGVYSEKFRETIYGHQLVAAALNNRPVKVAKQVSEGYGSSKTTKTVVDQAATQACAVRVDEIKDDFKQWAKKRMQEDPELAQRIEKIYNDKFNALVPMQIDDEFLPQVFEGANMNISLYDHQKRGVMRGLTAPTMLAHEVGTGKSFTLISTAMEMRRLGTAKKPMIVVQNATVAQITSDAKLLYPNAKVLSLSEKDRTAEGRRSFYAKIKFNDWDLIIVPQSTFERIPDSPERELQFIQEKIDEKKHVIEAAHAAGVDSRELQRLKKELEKIEQEYGDVYLDNDPANIDRSKDTGKKKKKDAKREAASLDKAETKAKEMLDRAVDDVQFFDDLGVDALLVDEAHEYKHLGFQTSIGRGIKGIDPSYSKKCAGLYNKTRSIFEKAGWKNVVFATGTPISNTAAEIWTFMKYLMPADVMQANDIYYFDDFVHNFGNISQMLEFATSGKFKENTRFAAYVNKPELIRIWSQVADTVLTREVGAVKDRVPEKEGGKDQDVFLPQSPSLISIMAAVRAELERFENMDGKQKKENSHIPLTMYGVAKRAAIDPRLVNADAPDEPLSKTNAAVKEIVKDLKETESYKGAVAVFCDNQNRKGADGSIDFNIYEDMREKMIAQGVPADQIAIIKSGMSIVAKQKVFDAVNNGSIRVVLGSTQTLGTGVNMQERLHLLIHMDAPDRPMDYTQRNGRIERQGNLHRVWGKTIRIVRFGVEDSLDVTAYQRLKTKSGFIDSIMDGKGALLNNQVDRTVEEEEEGLFDNPVAVLSGSQYALKKNQAERELRKYQGKKAQWEADQVYISNTLRYDKQVLQSTEENIKEEERKLAKIKSMFPDGKVKTITVEGTKIDMTKDDGAKKLGEAIKEKINDPVNATVKKLRENQIYNDENHQYTIELDGHPVNFTVSIYRTSDWEGGKMKTTIHKGTQYSSSDLETQAQMSGRSVKDYLEEIIDEVVSGRDSQDRIDAYRAKIDRINRDDEQMRQREGQPFQYDKELEAAKKNVEEYTELMKQEMKDKEAKYAEQQREAEASGNTFNLAKAEESVDEDELYRADEDDEFMFFSNAKMAVESIRQEKATPEQWLSMITKNGGMKAGEDKWLGLSDWLSNSDKRTLTKDEILDYIRENQIDIEEVHYSDKGGEVFDEIEKRYPGFGKAYSVEEDDFDGTPSYSIKDLKVAVDYYNSHHPENYRIDIDSNGNITDDQYDDLINYAAELFEYGMKSSEVRGIDPTRLNYTTFGLDNKREIALVVPTIEPYGQHDTVHFGDAGGGRAVAWIRFGETTDEAGHKVLVIDEIQSKRHQEGREKGYKSDVYTAEVKEKEEKLRSDHQNLVDKRDKLVDRDLKRRDEIRESKEGQACIGDDGYVKKEKVEEYQALFDNDKELNDLYLQRQALNRNILVIEQAMRAMNGWSVDLVPDAPFDKNWHELAMKRMLRYAAENGYDKIAWTTGDQQAERYDIGGVVPYIDVKTNPKEEDFYRDLRFSANGNGCRVAADSNGKITLSEGLGDGVEGKTLNEVFGKDVASMIMEAKDGSRIDLQNKRIGGEGMKGFYDQILPRFMDKYGKKWGVEVHDINLPQLESSAQTMHSVEVTPAMRQSVMMGQPMFREIESFQNGELFPIRMTTNHSSYDVLGTRRTYSVDLLPDEFATQQSLLDAVRNVYPEYYVTLEDANLKMQTWESVMTDALNIGKQKRVKGKESYIERKTRNAINAVNQLADLMHLNVEILTTTEGLTGKKARSKGFFNPKTGKITIVLPNHSNQSDVIRTLLHEGVAHFGLRNMFGEHFDTFLDNVYNNAEDDIKARIDAAAKRNGWSRHVATEEYLARLAERTDFEHAIDSGWWKRIKDFFVRMLAEAGLRLDAALSDNDLRYILWRSYDHLVHPDDRRNIFDKAKEVQMQSRLKVGNYAEGANRPAAEAMPVAAELSRTDYASDEINSIVDKAKADGTYMKAPNGQPTNLNELQWAQVRTKAFKNWFGDWENDPENASKVVDENGEPKVMYHGTNLSIVNKGEPFWTFHPDTHFGTRDQAGDRVSYNTDGVVKMYDVFLNIRNPQRRNDADQDYLEDHGMTMSEFWEQSVGRAKGLGHDGIVYLNEYEGEVPEDSWIAFNPNQIKSATDNSGDFSTEDDDIRYSIRTKEPPKKTGKGYKVFVLKNGQLYPPMVANPGGEGTPIGVWLDADAAPVSGTSKTGRPQVKAGGKGTQGGSGELAYRPGWHLGTIPYALQFNRKDENGEKTLFPNNFVWAEVEYADDVDYQKEAHDEGVNANGKYQHSLAGLKHVPTDGSYKYRTNPNPNTDEWIITGAMRVNKILSREEVDDLVRKAGREPQKVQDGDILTQEAIDELNNEIKATKEADEMGLLYSDPNAWDDDVAQQMYEKAVAKDSLKWQEAWQDSMASLKTIQDAIATETGKAPTGAENAYNFENRMHGRAKNMTEQYDWQYYRPMLKAFSNFIKANNMTREEGIDYLISKSGLERNVYYAFRDAAQAKLAEDIKKERAKLEKDYAKRLIDEGDYILKKKEIEEKERNGVDDIIRQVRETLAYQRAKDDYQDGSIGYTEYLRRIESVIRSHIKDYDTYAKDYSGLTETFAKDMYDDAQEYKKAAQRTIDPNQRRQLWKEYDEKMRQAYMVARQVAEDAVFAAESGAADYATDLWDKINAATKETLKQSYESGLMDRNIYNKVRAMFDYYIPLRGWEEDKASDVYTYMGKENVFNPAVKKTWGRKSQADNPLAYIGNIAVSTILSGHRNQMKQHFLNYVMNNPTSLVNISESWYENIAPEGESPVWILRTADTAGKSADEIVQIVNDFNDEMRQKQREGKAMPVTGRLRLDVHATSGQKAEHVVEVQRAGHTYQLYINGNPKAAQALNGTAAKAVSRISQTYLGQKVTKLNRSMAMFFTSKNPAFVISNLSRDLNMAGASVAIKEGKAYNAKFLANVAKVLTPRLAAGDVGKMGVRGLFGKGRGVTGMMPKLLSKWKQGKLDMSDETQRYFKEFMDEGGETGFVNMLSIESFKEKMQKEIREMNGSSILGSRGVKETSAHKALRLLGDTFEFYNRCAEDATRFIVYMTSRQMGKSLEDSIADAKDVTLNFNRKGTGAMGNAEVRDLFIFVNPAIQALGNMYKMATGNTLKFGVVTAAFMVGGAFMAALNQWMLNLLGDDDDKDAYWNLPPWVRKNNLVFWIPFTKNFVTIPLAQEFRVFYGVGEMMASMILEHPVDKWGLEVFSSVADLVPINPTGNGGNLMVDFAPTMVQPLMQVGENIDFTGKPIWKENQGNKHAPMYEKAYVSTPTWMVKLSEGINDITGGNEGKKGAIEKYAPFWGDYINNPAVWNHLLQGYFGGMYNTIAKTFDVGVTAAQGEIPKVYQTPVLNRFLNRPVERDNAGVLGEEYYGLTEDRDALQYELRTWQKKAADGEEGAQEHVDEILSSNEWKRAEVVSHYERIIKDLKAGERAATNDADKIDFKLSINMYKQQMMEELKAIDEGKEPLAAAIEAFDNAKTFAEKNKIRMRIERLMLRQNGMESKTKGRNAEVDKARSYITDEEQESRKVNEDYLQLATAEMIEADAKIRVAKAKIKTYTDKYKELISQGKQAEAAKYRKDHSQWFKADAIVQSQSRNMSNNKKLLGKGHDAAIMKLIDYNRSQILKAIEGL